MALSTTHAGASPRRLATLVALLTLLSVTVTTPHDALAAGDPPTISSLSATSASVSGGPSITITGLEFVEDDTSAATVTFQVDGQASAAATVTAWTATELTVTVPASSSRAAGLATVTVTTGDGSDTATFFYRPAIDDTQQVTAQRLLGALASRSQGKAVTITPDAPSSAPYTISGTDSTTSNPYSFQTDRYYNPSQHTAWDWESDERAVAGGTWTVDSSATFDGRTAYQLKSSSLSCPPNASTGIVTYCSVFGPEISSEHFYAAQGQALSVNWAAQNGGDDYEVYAYLVAVNADGTALGSPVTDTHTVVLHGRGSSVTSWRTASADIPADGYYRFRFVNGSYDASGGLALGAQMYVASEIFVGLSNEITFATIADQQAADGPLTVPVSATSTDPVVLTASGGCSVDSVTATEAVVSFDAPGTCTLTASQGTTDGGYAPASSVTRSFTITASPNTIDFPDVGSRQGQVGGSVSIPVASDAQQPVTVVSSTVDVCTVTQVTAAAAELRIEAHGTCTLTASQTATGLFAAAADVARTFTLSAPPPPAPEEPAPTDPVRTGTGTLPAPGGAEVEVEGEPETVSVAPTGSGGVAVSGGGFVLEVEPEAVDDDGTGTPPEPAPGDIGEPGSDADLVVTRGRTAEVRVQGFRPYSPVSVWLFSEPTLLGEFRTGPDGALTAATEAIGDDVTACLHTLHAEGVLADGREVRLSLGVWVDAVPYPFGDVAADGPHRRAIGCLADQGTVRGTGDGNYSPGATTTRGQAASMLARQFGLTASGPPTHADVVGTPHEEDVAALVEAGAAQGFDADTFGPDRPVTRGQFAAMVVALMQPAADAPAATSAVDRLVAVGAIIGFDDGTRRPDQHLSRGQAASVLVRVQSAEG